MTFDLLYQLGLMTYDLENLSQETKRLVELEVKTILEVCGVLRHVCFIFHIVDGK